MKSKNLNPVSPEAIKAACTCPVMDNCGDRGYMGSTGIFVMSENCPIHGNEQTEELRAEPCIEKTGQNTEELVRCLTLLSEAAHSSMRPEKAMQLAEDFCGHESWGLDFWREPMTVLAAEVARLREETSRIAAQK